MAAKAARYSSRYPGSTVYFPVVPAVLLICVVAFLQVLLTYGVSANFRKLSLIDRIRYAE